MNRGYLLKPSAPEDYHFQGNTKLGAVALTDGHWLNWVPLLVEYQNVNNVETFNCTGFATTNCFEILFRRQFGLDMNFSDRALGIMAGTKYGVGNDPWSVCEVARHDGLVPENLLPFSTDIKTGDDYFKPSPVPDYVVRAGKDFLSKYTLGHEHVEATPGAMKAALMLSPLNVGVFSWIENERGLMYPPEGTDPNHDITVVDYVDGEYWVILDSYTNEIKHLVWDFKFYQVERYSVDIKGQEVSNRLSIFSGLISFISSLISKLYPKPMPEPEPIVPVTKDISEITVDDLPIENPPKPVHVSRIVSWANAIMAHEGYYTGSRSWRNKNPFNFRFAPLIKELGAIGADDGNYAIFTTYEKGFEAGCQFLRLACKDQLKAYHRDRTLQGFFRVYAPSSDNNNPDQYADAVAKKLGVSPLIDIKELL